MIVSRDGRGGEREGESLDVIVVFLPWSIRDVYSGVFGSIRDVLWAHVYTCVHVTDGYTMLRIMYTCTYM